MIGPLVAKFQIGKNGVTPGVLDSLALAFTNHREVRVSVLKSACRDREALTLLAKNLSESLIIPNAYRIIGYTIVIRKLRKEKK